MARIIECPECRCNWSFTPPIRFDELGPNNKFRPGTDVRCVECKTEFTLPITRGCKD